MHQLARFIKNGQSVYVSASADAIDEISKYMSPFIECEIVKMREDGCWLFSIDKVSDKYISTDNKKIINFELSNLDEPEREYWVYEDDKVIYISRPDDTTWKTQLLTRLIRDSLRNLLFYSNMHYLHGAFIVYRGKGVCILGNKQSGKTTSVLNLLSSNYSKFVSNDDVSVSYTDKGWIGYGWPRAISIRNDSLIALKKIGIEYEVPCSLLHPYNENNIRNNYTTFYPYEFSEFIDSELLESHKVDYVFFAKFSDSNTVKEINSQCGSKRVKNFIEDDINKYFKDFEGFFAAQKAQHNANNIFEGNSIRYFNLTQNFNRLNKLHEVLDEIINEENLDNRISWGR